MRYDVTYIWVNAVLYDDEIGIMNWPNCEREFIAIFVSRMHHPSKNYFSSASLIHV